MKRLLKKVLKITAIVLPLLLAAGWFSFWSLMSALMERQSSSAEIRLTHVGGSIYLVDAELGGRRSARAWPPPSVPTACFSSTRR